MSMEIENVKKGKSIKRLIKKYCTKNIIIGILILITSVSIIIGIKPLFNVDGKTVKIGFEDIGELATQTSYASEIQLLEDGKTFYGVKIPFTQSKYIYSYDVSIKAGFNFEDIKWAEKGKTIEVEVPAAKILSSDIDLNSFKLYHEDESIFTPITITDNNEALKNLKERAQENAKTNGLLDKAHENLEIILTAFFANSYDLKEYEIIYKHNKL